MNDIRENIADGKYSSDQCSGYTLFFADCLEELGLTNHPKSDMLCEKAWQAGHSSGMAEVWLWMQDLGELLQ